ncbi:hypothetical protein GCM10010232_33910 [Streptomyces amakusaensis]
MKPAERHARPAAGSAGPLPARAPATPYPATVPARAPPWTKSGVKRRVPDGQGQPPHGEQGKETVMPNRAQSTTPHPHRKSNRQAIALAQRRNGVNLSDRGRP